MYNLWVMSKWKKHLERTEKKEKPVPVCPFPEITDVWVNLHDHTALGEQ